MIRIVLIEPYFYDAEGICGCFDDLKTYWHHFPCVESFLAAENMPDFDTLILGSAGDADLERANPLSAIMRRYPHIPVIMFTRTDDASGLVSLVEERPFAVISKRDGVREIRDAVIRSMMEKEGVVISPHVEKRLSCVATSCNMPMTRMEQKVISWMLEGQSIGDIAQATQRSNKTISAHKRNAMRKLGLHNNVAFCRYLANHRRLAGEGSVHHLR